MHNIIRAALRLTVTRTSGCKVKQNIILDAEMVAFHGDVVDGKFPSKLRVKQDSLQLYVEFWRIRQMIEDTACGVRSRKRPPESEE